ncbi:hypothetical protein ACQCT5_04555 [Sutcliffiella halmapala]
MEKIIDMHDYKSKLAMEEFKISQDLFKEEVQYNIKNIIETLETADSRDQLDDFVVAFVNQILGMKLQQFEKEVIIEFIMCDGVGYYGQNIEGFILSHPRVKELYEVFGVDLS